jgi:hypothetical protein
MGWCAIQIDVGKTTVALGVMFGTGLQVIAVGRRPMARGKRAFPGRDSLGGSSADRLPKTASEAWVESTSYAAAFGSDLSLAGLGETKSVDHLGTERICRARSLRMKFGWPPRRKRYCVLRNSWWNGRGRPIAFCGRLAALAGLFHKPLERAGKAALVRSVMTLGQRNGWAS